MSRRDEQLHDDEMEIVDEAETHDTERAEEQSVNATGKHSKGMKQAPMRKGDKRNSDPMPKSKAGKIGAMYDKLNLLKNEEIESLYDYVMGDKFLEEEVESREIQETELNYEDDLSALVESEGTLSEDFKKNAGVIFESALNFRVGKEVSRLEEEYQERFDEEFEETRDQLIESVDSYLNYAVETFMEDNKLAVQTGLRTEIAEDFMEKLKGLFEESYIDVPDSKIDLVDELAEQVEELETALNESTAKQISMSEELESFKRAAIVIEHADGLSDIQVEKLATLAENTSYESEEQFAEKVQTLKEAHFKLTTKSDNSINEELGEDGEPVEMSDRMSMYTSALTRSIK